MDIKTITLPALLLLATAASARSSSMDARFMRDAFRDNRIDANLGRLALKQGRTADIRDFGARAVSDHGHAEADLVRMAKASGLTIPGKMDGTKSNTYLRLRRLHGARFDRSYRAAILSNHRKDVAEYEREVRTTRMPALRDYAKKTLPVLRRHIAEIQAVKV